MASATDEAAFQAELEAMNREYALALQAMVKDAHYLAGTGATFGLPPISTAAGVLEMLLWPLAKAGTQPDAGLTEAINKQMDGLQAAVDVAA